MLKTERLILRRWENSDAEALYEYARDPDVGPIAGWPPHQSIDESRDVIKNVFNGKEAYAICLKTDGIAIGAIELKLSDIFEDKPQRWGLRGDPYFWDYLKEHAENMEIISPDELENWIKEEYFSLSEKALTDKYMDFAVIKQFAHGGMSSGGVDNGWWIREGIPLLKSRLSTL